MAEVKFGKGFEVCGVVEAIVAGFNLLKFLLGIENLSNSIALRNMRKVPLIKL
ncbi:MAG: hypothetical protein F6K24_10710 [Okeania sp. SIO2D1]|nr:hypothetical protein [Okeania sp. SIO2D1]